MEEKVDYYLIDDSNRNRIYTKAKELTGGEMPSRTLKAIYVLVVRSSRLSYEPLKTSHLVTKSDRYIKRDEDYLDQLLLEKEKSNREKRLKVFKKITL